MKVCVKVTITASLPEDAAELANDRIEEMEAQGWTVRGCPVLHSYSSEYAVSYWYSITFELGAAQ